MLYSVVIPTWNGAKLLEKNLPQVIKSLPKNSEIIIVDNGSTDKTRSYLRYLQASSSSHMVRIIVLPENKGFGYACNLGAQKAKGEILILLNNDVVPEKGFLKPIAKHFQNPKVFAVSFHEPQFSWARGKFVNGFLAHSSGPKTKKVHPSLWASGGSAAFRRSLFLELGGFDPLYHPFYWEDLDLCYRAQKRGYQVLWDPQAIVHHRHESSVRRFSPRFVILIAQRNHLLFIWKNITSPVLFRQHLFFLLCRLFTHPGYCQVVSAALCKLSQVRRLRQIEKTAATKTDEEIFTSF